MAYLIGLHWIPTRDNFIIDFCLIIIAILGLNNFCNSFVFDKGLWGRRLAGYGIPLITAGIVIFAPANLYYVHWMMVDAPPDYPYYKGIPQVRDAFKSIKESPFTRIMIVNKPTTSFPFGFGESMFEEVNQVTQYSSLTTKNYKDWALFRRTGIRPEQKLSIYNSAYTKKTIARLPKRNSLGMTPDVVYFYILIARPPLELDALRFLGINYVVVFNKSMADSGVGPFDLTGVDIPKRFEEMGLEDVREMPAGYYLYSAKIIKEGTIYEKETITIGRVPGPLPRAYRVSGVSEDRLEEFKQEMVVSISSEDTLKSAHYEFKYQAVDIDDYQAEKVQLDVQGEEDSYLVLADLNHPFWHAMLDGKEVKIIPAFHTMRGIKVPPGNHQVEFYLEVPHFSTTVVLSLLVIVLVSISFPFRTRYKFLHLER